MSDWDRKMASIDKRLESISDDHARGVELGFVAFNRAWLEFRGRSLEDYPARTRAHDAQARPDLS